ncbi:hypothetical protein BpHYR1_028561 [Brachionus plicatilis]|uniref:Uncharacterized protein n=1 Tax=Brachionus plicatilis TaxID=10195 RepID=A0A3M7RUS6_BRAPC|nr:hypothetical protein BpHYR1_028561 [Brachionus plicatilis]
MHITSVFRVFIQHIQCCVSASRFFPSYGSPSLNKNDKIGLDKKFRYIANLFFENFIYLKNLKYT